MKPIVESMTAEECWRHVGSRGVGRIGFDAGNGPRVHPVNYTSDGSRVYVLTSETSELARFTRLFAEGGLVTFEVDQLDATRGECWSVLMAAQVVDVGHQRPDDPKLRPSPRPAGHDTWGVQLHPRQVTGRRLVAAESSSDVLPIPGESQVRADC
jgi:hypothetical protein